MLFLLLVSDGEVTSDEKINTEQETRTLCVKQMAKWRLKPIFFVRILNFEIIFRSSKALVKVHTVPPSHIGFPWGQNCFGDRCATHACEVKLRKEGYGGGRADKGGEERPHFCHFSKCPAISSVALPLK